MSKYLLGKYVVSVHFRDFLLKNRRVRLLPLYILITDGKILLIANTDISLFSRKGYFYRSDSKTTIKVIGKLNDWTMTSNWKLHAKRLFELEHGVLYIKNSMARDQALLSLFDRTVSPIREL